MFDSAMPTRRRRIGPFVGVVAAAVVVALAVAYFVMKTPDPAATGPAPTGAGSATGSGSGSPRPAAPAIPNVTAPADGTVLNKASLADLAVALDGPAAAGATITLDGAAVQPTTSGSTLTWKPATPLADGTHALVITGAALPGGKVERSFTVDTTAPKLTVAAPKPLAPGATAVTISGTTDPSQTVTAGDQTATAGADGTFTLRFAQAPSALTVQAKDAAGNVTSTDISVVTVLPRTRAVHMTALAWDYKPKREPVLQMLKDKRLTAVELDIKDEDGYIGYNSQVPLAQQAGAAKKIYDAKKAIAEIHAAGGRVIGRIVCFRDPTLAEWAWKHGHKDAVIQTPDGKPYTGTYGSGGFAFTNFANQLVSDYNNDIAVEAAQLGFDDILFDYVRRPDGKISQMRMAGLKIGATAHATERNASAAVAEFVHQTRLALGAAGVKTLLGVSVFGIAATRPGEIAQDIPMLGKYVDYVAPMVYPSHWGVGEYDVAQPNREPYKIVQRSLVDFQKDLKETNAAVVPWLQDFSLYGVHYGVPQVKAQIKGAHDDGIEDYIMWNAGCNYQAAAIPKVA
ncbi:MAG: hypothetical protein JWM93_3761 [Frankiales bacterium]|nr:hypothetical protein [Frankiales bacterium]